MKMVLAIRGDYHNGNEVIKILEMLGGVNSKNLDGTANRSFYFICPNTSVINAVFEEYMLITDWETHSLKSFKREYPYKTGDKLVINGKDCSIVETYWNGFTICYKVDYGIYQSEYTAERIQEFFVEKPIEQKVVATSKARVEHQAISPSITQRRKCLSKTVKWILSANCDRASISQVRINIKLTLSDLQWTSELGRRCMMTISSSGNCCRIAE